MADFPPAPSNMPAAVAPLVLVVDDTPINRSVACILLDQIGCRSMAVESGAAALAVVLAQPIDLVLMDCSMPGMDGFEATLRIRQAIAPGRRLSIVALTGRDLAEDRERCRAAGMDGHLCKPLQIATLREVVFSSCAGSAAPAGSPAGAAADGGETLDPAPLAAFERMRPGSGAILLGVFLKDLAVIEAALGRAVADGDLDAVACHAHKLKGAALTVGARALGMAMRELKRQAGDGSLPACREGWGRVAALLAATRAAIGARCGAAPPRPQPPCSGGRAPAEVLAEQRALVLRTEGLVGCMEAMPLPVMLLNAERQIVAMNGLCQRIMGVADQRHLIGRRPGEALGCIHAKAVPDGCGATPACAFCGAVQAVVSGLHEQIQTVREARMTIGPESGHACDLEMTATPTRLAGQCFIMLAMRDIAGEKRRKALERIFFHDVLNSVGGIHGLAAQLAQGRVAPGDAVATHQLMERLAQQVIDEVRCQRLLADAGSGEPHADLQVVDPSSLLREVRDAYAGQAVAAQRSLVLGALATVRVRTDQVLFRRVLGNLVKNALEAVPPGATVTIGSRVAAGSVLCTVHNPGEMPPAVRAQLFQRSFTTKGEGRGLGAWSAKLLGERYLGGRLSFTSEAQAGTELVFALEVVQP